MTSLPPESPLRQYIDVGITAMDGELRTGGVVDPHALVSISEYTFTVRRMEPDELLTDDTVPHDVTPDDCWRCDATLATTPVGLCDACHHDLSEEPS